MPAAAGVVGKSKCPRCHGLLIPPAEARATSLVSDCGVELDAFAQSGPLSTLPDTLQAAPADLLRIERKLRPLARRDEAHHAFTAVEASGRSWVDWPADFAEPPQDLKVAAPSYADSATRPPSWGMSLLLTAGATLFLSGVLLLVAANVLVHPAAWRWGFAATMAGEGLLVGGLAALAARLWRHSRRMTAQLDGIDGRLEKVQTTLSGGGSGVTAGSLRGALRRAKQSQSF